MRRKVRTEQSHEPIPVPGHDDGRVPDDWDLAHTAGG